MAFASEAHRCPKVRPAKVADFAVDPSLETKGPSIAGGIFPLPDGYAFLALAPDSSTPVSLEPSRSFLPLLRPPHRGPLRPLAALRSRIASFLLVLDALPPLDLSSPRLMASSTPKAFSDDVACPRRFLHFETKQPWSER